MNTEAVILSGASRSLIARGAVEEPVLSLPKEPATRFLETRFLALSGDSSAVFASAVIGMA